MATERDGFITMKDIYRAVRRIDGLETVRMMLRKMLDRPEGITLADLMLESHRVTGRTLARALAKLGEAGIVTITKINGDPASRRGSQNSYALSCMPAKDLRAWLSARASVEPDERGTM